MAFDMVEALAPAILHEMSAIWAKDERPEAIEVSPELFKGIGVGQGTIYGIPLRVTREPGIVMRVV